MKHQPRILLSSCRVRLAPSSAVVLLCLMAATVTTTLLRPRVPPLALPPSSYRVPKPSSTTQHQPLNSHSNSAHYLQTSSASSSASSSDKKDRLTLTLGDLPGYTGWARPTKSTAHWYTVQPSLLSASSTSTAGQTITMEWCITCVATHCHNHTLQALWDVRAYGPSLLPAVVTPHSSHNNTYTVAVSFFDPGDYVLEIVLAFSHLPVPLSAFPLPPTAALQEPLYEGYLLPEAPLWVHVVMEDNDDVTTATDDTTVVGPPPPPPHHQKRYCDARDLYESHAHAALHKARWKVTSRVRGGSGDGHHNFGDVQMPNISLPEYQHGDASIGFTADYVYQNCTLASLSDLKEQETVAPPSQPSQPTQRTLVVFIGDSHMRKQYNLFLEYYGNHNSPTTTTRMTAVYLKTNDGLAVRWPEITRGLDKVKAFQQQQQPSQQQGNTTSTTDATAAVHILFNAGLHEIAILCSQRRATTRARTTTSIPDDQFSCMEQYRRNLSNLTRLVLAAIDTDETDNSLALASQSTAVFQSTSAGWLKWGNWGFGWEPNRTQEYPLDAHACADFNDIAYQVMQDHNVPVMDSYWLTLARPDHRQIDGLNSRGKKLVHAGIEIYKVLLRKWMSLVLLP